MRRFIPALLALVVFGCATLGASAAPPYTGNTSGTDTAAMVNAQNDIDTELGAMADAACATDAGTCALGALIKRSNQRLTSLITALGAPFQVGGTLGTSGYSAAVPLTRTNDTNAYTANDVLGAATGSTAALTFPTIGPSGGEVMITSVALEIDAAAVISGETSYRLYLYNVTPPSALGDNAAWDLPSGDRASYLGYVDLGTVVDLGSTLYVQADGLNRQIKLSGTSLFGYLVTVGAYTPTASRVHVITLHTVAM